MPRENWPQGRHKVPGNKDWDLATLQGFARLSQVIPHDLQEACRRLDTAWYRREKNHGMTSVHKGEMKEEQEKHLRKDVETVCQRIKNI
jgi:alkylated DNA nucleotide flippase Atl1